MSAALGQHAWVGGPASQGLGALDFGDLWMGMRSEKLTRYRGWSRTRGWVLFAFGNWCRSCRVFLSLGDPSTRAFQNPQLTHLPVRANVAEVVDV